VSKKEARLLFLQTSIMVQGVQVYAAMLGTHSYNELAYNGNMLLELYA
jgi:hypothetical protein